MWSDAERQEPFRLDPEFLARFRDRAVPWGFGALSWVTYKRSYSRGSESWWQTCQRVVEGMFSLQQIHCRMHGIGMDPGQTRARAEEAYTRMWGFKWTPPGRGLWIMGTPFLLKRGSAALNNCGFVSTRHLGHDFSAPFVWMLHMSMLGVGVGFDTRGAGRARLVPPARDPTAHRIDDSREGWCNAVARLLDAHVGKGSLPSEWDFSAIRPRGSALEGFGGQASGPDALRELLGSLERLYASRLARSESAKVDSTLIVDTMNLIGRCVVAGGIRRSAQIALGEATDPAFLRLKTDREALLSHRWASNNSIFAHAGMDYAPVLEFTEKNGEPGFFWLDNARRYGRLADPEDDADEPALGCNPCAEQTLWDRELCCLVETFPAHHANFEDYRRTLEIAIEYAKTVTLLPTHDPDTNRVMQRNRRLGCSMTGVVQAIERHGLGTLLDWCDEGYAWVRRVDAELSARFGVPRSIKLTSIKPSGTVSLLAGATPGVHFGHAPYYLRRLRVRNDSELASLCAEAGFEVEPDAYAADTSVIAFPVRVPHLSRSLHQVSMLEKLELAARLQEHWSDNQVSCTVDFDRDSEGPLLGEMLRQFETRLKGISFLPRTEHGYVQPPYEEVSADEYEARAARLRPFRAAPEHEHLQEAAFCDNSECELPPARLDR